MITHNYFSPLLLYRWPRISIKIHVVFDASCSFILQFVKWDRYIISTKVFDIFVIDDPVLFTNWAFVRFLKVLILCNTLILNMFWVLRLNGSFCHRSFCFFSSQLIFFVCSLANYGQLVFSLHVLQVFPCLAGNNSWAGVTVVWHWFFGLYLFLLFSIFWIVIFLNVNSPYDLFSLWFVKKGPVLSILWPDLPFFRLIIYPIVFCRYKIYLILIPWFQRSFYPWTSSLFPVCIVVSNVSPAIRFVVVLLKVNLSFVWSSGTMKKSCKGSNKSK